MHFPIYSIHIMWFETLRHMKSFFSTDKAILDKYRNQTPQKSTQFDEQDYEDVKIQEEDTCFDYDEPIPHSRILQELL